MTWVIGTLARQLWAVPARTSSQSDLPFINYNMQVSFGLKAAVPAGWRHGRPTSISRRPAETAPRATARAVDATRIPHPGARELRKRQLPLGRSCTRFDYYVSYYHMQIAYTHWEDRNMQRSITRIRTSHVGRLPPPKGWEDMPGRLASAEITDPAVIAAQVTQPSRKP